MGQGGGEEADPWVDQPVKGGCQDPAVRIHIPSWVAYPCSELFGFVLLILATDLSNPIQAAAALPGIRGLSAASSSPALDMGQASQLPSSVWG